MPLALNIFAGNYFCDNGMGNNTPSKSWDLIIFQTYDFYIAKPLKCDWALRHLEEL